MIDLGDPGPYVAKVVSLAHLHDQAAVLAVETRPLFAGNVGEEAVSLKRHHTTAGIAFELPTDEKPSVTTAKLC